MANNPPTSEPRESFLSRRKILTAKEFADYKKYKIDIEGRKARQKLSELKKESAYGQSQVARAKTSQGRASRFAGKILNNIRTLGKPEMYRAAYERQGQLPPSFMQKRDQTIAGMKTGTRGRPKGTLDKRYAAFGGVFGWRKAEAHRRALERMQFRYANTVSPEQAAYLKRLEMQRQAQSLNPERRIFPDTNGEVATKSIQDEIDAASHLFD